MNMKALSAAALLLLLWAGDLLAEVKITGDTKVPGNKIVRLAAEGGQAGAALIWDVTPEDVADIEETGGRLLFTGPAGTYKVKVRSVSFKDGKTTIETARATVTIGSAPPGPPSPPDPPNPPDPPGPAPIPVNGFRVLIVYEPATLSKLPAAQLDVLYSKTVRDYLNAKCVVGPDGKTKEWRAWGKDTDASAESKLWQDAMARKRSSVPWLIISDGAKGYEGPLPGNVEAMMNLLKRFGG